MIIYLITNKVNGKQYVGQTMRKLSQRWTEHNSSKKGCVVLSNAIKKYGRDGFTIEEIDKASSLEELNEKEKYFINKYNTLSPNGYNLSTGGNAPIFSEETRKRMSDAKKNSSFVPWNKGLTKLDDHRVGKQGSRGIENPRYGKPGFWKGKKKSIKTIEKLKKSKIGIVPTVTEKVIKGRKATAESHKIAVFCPKTNKCYNSINEAAVDTGTHQSNVSRVMNGKLNHIKGYTFVRVGTTN
jgi:group I intron endonuclease